MQGLAVATSETRCAGSVGQSLSQSVGRESAAAFEEEEVGGLAVARMRQCPLRPALSAPAVQSCEGDLVQGDGAFGGELAEGDLEPAAVAGEVEQAVQLEVE